MSAQQDYFRREQLPADVPIWREGLIGIDWLALHYSPVYYGLGVPRGDGSAVILVPGFLATDFYLNDMYFWLMRVGYKPYMSKIGRNADCLNLLVGRLTATMEKASAQTGRKVHLIGHSLGGVLSHSAAVQRPDLVASVTTMASPFRGISSHPFVLNFGNVVRQRVQFVKKREQQPGCFTSACTCPTSCALQNKLPESVVETAIYTKSDGIVDWRYCISDDQASNFEVIGTHGGLAFNPLVYRLIGNRLSLAVKKAKAEGSAVKPAA